MNTPLRIQAVREYFIEVDHVSESLFALGELIEAAQGKPIHHIDGLAWLVGIVAGELKAAAEMGGESLDSLEATLQK